MKTIVLSGPMFTVKVPLPIAPLEEMKATLKVVSPCKPAAKVSIGSTVKLQPLRVTEVSLVLSTPVALAQVTVLGPSSAYSAALITKVRLRPTFNPVGAVKTMVASGPTFTVNVPVVAEPPSEAKATLNVVSPCKPAARVSIGSTVKLQPLRVTDASLVLSTPVASPQVTV